MIVSRRLSVAPFVALILVAVVSAILSVAGWSGYRFYQEEQWNELRLEARRLAEQSAVGLALPLWSFDRGQMRQYADSLMRQPALAGLEVRLRPSGRLVLALERGPDWEVVESAAAAVSTGGVSWESAIMTAGEEIGAVRVDLSPRLVEADLARVRRAFLAVIAVTAVVLVFTLYALLRAVVLNPLGDVARFAVSVGGRRETGVPVPTAPLRGEMATLRSTLEKMVAELDARYAELGRHTERLRVSEQKFRTLFESTNDAILLIGDGGILACNPAAESLFGYSQAELVGRSPLDFSPAVQPDGRDSASRARDLIAAARAGRPQRFDWQHQRQDGSRFEVQVSLSAFAQEGQTVLQAVVRDVTTERRALQEAERERRFFAALFESLPGNAFVFDERGQVVRANQHRKEFFGVAQAGIPLPELSRSAAPEHEEKILQAFQRTLETGHATIEFEVRRLDGTLVPRLATAAALELDGRRYVVGMSIDLSERVRAEAALRESENRYRSLIHDLTDLVYAIGPDGRIAFVGPQVRRYGFTPEELVGREIAALVCAEDRAMVVGNLQRKLAAGGETQNIFRLLTKAEGVVWFEDTSRAVVDAAGRITGVSGMLRDITERKRAEEDRQALQSQLIQAQKMEAVGQLAGGVAHDFNNILTAILMHLGLLQKDAALPPEVRDSLRELELEARRAASLTRQLLLFSRRQALRTQVLELNSLLGDLLKMLRRLIGENIHLEFAGGGADVWLEADAGMIEQVVMNLVVNARDAMPEGGRVTLTTRLAQLDEAAVRANPEAVAGLFACLAVTDTGTGMDEATLKRIFEPFFTTKEAGKGTGLGLATVYGIVQQHRGWIEVRSTPGQGSTFEIFLPARRQSAVLPGPAAPEAPLPRGRETLLLVEDEPGVRRTMALALQRQGYRVFEAGDGAAALALWQRERATIALVISDVVMPGNLTGLDLAERMLGEKPGIKIVLMSGYSTDMVRRGLPTHPAVRFQSKPFEFAELARLVRSLLDAK